MATGKKAPPKPITGQELRTFRATHGLSQSQFATLLGVNPHTISNYERGAISVGLPGVWRWALIALSESLTGGDTVAPKRRPGVPHEDNLMREALLRTIITAYPGIELAKIARVWKRETGEKRSISHFSRRLRQAGCAREGGRWVVQRGKAKAKAEEAATA